MSRLAANIGDQTYVTPKARSQHSKLPSDVKTACTKAIKSFMRGEQPLKFGKKKGWPNLYGFHFNVEGTTYVVALADQGTWWAVIEVASHEKFWERIAKVYKHKNIVVPGTKPRSAAMDDDLEFWFLPKDPNGVVGLRGGSKYPRRTEMEMMVNTKPHPDRPEDVPPFISWVNVNPEYQRQGYATAMKEMMEEYLGQTVHHSSLLSEDGAAWATHTKEASMPSTFESWKRKQANSGIDVRRGTGDMAGRWEVTVQAGGKSKTQTGFDSAEQAAAWGKKQQAKMEAKANRLAGDYDHWNEEARYVEHAERDRDDYEPDDRDMLIDDPWEAGYADGVTLANEGGDFEVEFAKIEGEHPDYVDGFKQGYDENYV